VASTWNWTLQTEAAVRPIAVVVGREFIEHPPEVGLVDHDQVVKTFRPNGPHDALANGVRPWRLGPRPYARDAEVGQSLIKVRAVIGIPIVDP